MPLRRFNVEVMKLIKEPFHVLKEKEKSKRVKMVQIHEQGCMP